MTRLLKTAAIAALITGFANTAQAGSPTAFYTDAELAMVEPIKAAAPQTNTIELIQSASVEDDMLHMNSRIAVARMEGGRFMATPYSEEADWAFLDKRVDVELDILNAGDHFKYLPELDFQGIDTDNKIDEIRLTAANEGYSHVIVYGMGSDAYWSSFGSKALSETGLIVHEDCDSWDKAEAKALLVDTHTGEVLGAAKADDVTYNIGYLADDMERVLNALI